MIARATGLSPQELPYAAELMDVGEENEEWRTAMNVAYRSLATVILVDSCHENGFAAKVSQIPQEALPRRNWRFVDTSVHVEAEEREGWLSSKLTFNVESPFADWLRARVTEARYDAWCVEAIDDTNETTRQVQRDGRSRKVGRAVTAPRTCLPSSDSSPMPICAIWRQTLPRRARRGMPQLAISNSTTCNSTRLSNAIVWPRRLQDHA